MARPKDAAKSARRNSSEALWLPRPQSALLIRISPSSFDINIKPRIEKQYQKVEDNVTYWHAPAVVEAYMQYRSEKSGNKGVTPKEQPEVDEDVKRKRKFAADREELEFRKELMTVVSTEDWEHRLSGRFWNIVEAHGKQIKRAFANPGILLFNDFLDELKRELAGDKVVA